MSPADVFVERWAPLGRALRDYQRGDTGARFVVHSDLWDSEITLVEEYYRPRHQRLSEIELRALALCRGRVLDLGAGAGRHALELQERGHEVTAVDVSPEAVEVMRRRGVRDARCGDLTAVANECFDTLLLMMHGIGLAGTLDGLTVFLEAARQVLRADGQILCDSADLALVLPPPDHPPDRSAAGVPRYSGEVEFRLSYGDLEGRPYPWLFVDPRTLEAFAAAGGFDFELGAMGGRGAYLARLLRRQTA